MSETRFVKAKKERNYTVIDNTFLKDVSLSWKAKGLMAYLLSLPDDWSIHLSEIEKHSTDGMTVLRSSIKELKEHGYLKASQKKVKGKFSEMVYTIIENPCESLEKPFAENLKTENPKTENQTLLNTNINKVLNIESTNINSGKPETAENLSTSFENVESEKTVEKKQKSEYTQIIERYFDNFKQLYDNGQVMTEKPVVNFKQAGAMVKGLLKTISKESIFKVLDTAMNDMWIVSQGYPLAIILSATQVNKLLNAKPMQQYQQNTHVKKEVYTDEEYLAGMSDLDTIGF